MRMTITRGTGLLLCALTCGCGPKTREPSDWMHGVFSTSNVGADLVEVTDQYTIYDDGTVGVALHYGCGSHTDEWEFEWEPRDADSFVMTKPPDAEPFVEDRFEEWIIRQPSPCTYEVVRVRDGEERAPLPLFRGELCMHWLPEDPACIGSTCRLCSKHWCEEPPACEESAPSH